MELTYEMLLELMHAPALYALFFLLGIIFTIIMLFAVRWAPAIWQGLRNAKFVREIFKWKNEEKRKNKKGEKTK